MTPDQLQIRPLSYNDLPQVVSIERQAFPTPWSLSMFVLELSKGSSFCLAALTGAELKGYLVCSRYPDAWHLMNVAVDPAARRHGIASALLEDLLLRAGEDQDYTLEVRTSNAPAIALYERYGFRAAGMRPRYYPDTGEDAMIMWRTAPAHSASGAGG